MFCAGSFISPAPRKDRPGLSWFQMKLWIGKITSRKWILAVSQVHSGSSTDLTSEIVFDVRIQIYLNDHVQFSPLVETIHSERCRSVPDSGNTKFTERRFASNNSLRGTNSEGTNCHNKAKFKIRSSRLSSRRVEMRQHTQCINSQQWPRTLAFVFSSVYEDTVVLQPPAQVTLYSPNNAFNEEDLVTHPILGVIFSHICVVCATIRKPTL